MFITDKKKINKVRINKSNIVNQDYINRHIKCNFQSQWNHYTKQSFHL